MWIDSHAHLFDLPDQDLRSHVEEAAAGGVGVIVSTATGIQHCNQIVHHCETFPQIWGAAGISPFDVVNLPATWFEELSLLLNHPKIIALGETGIDATNPRYPALDLQLPVFEQQLYCARDYSLPVIIHSRGAEMEAVGRCRACNVELAVFHCFTGSKEALRAVTGNGYYVSISGIVTFPRSDLKELLQYIPPERLLIETDTPYLAPVPHRGKKNRPALVRFVGEAIARQLGMSPEHLQQQIERNFRRLFSKYRPDDHSTDTDLPENPDPVTTGRD